MTDFKIFITDSQKISTGLTAWPFIWTNMISLQGCFVPSLLEISPVVLKRKIYKVCQCKFPFSQLSPFGKGRGPSFEHNWIPIIQGCFMPSLVEIGPLFLKRKIFKVCQCIFDISLLSPLWKGRCPSFEQTWIHPHHPRMLCAKFGWN